MSASQRSTGLCPVILSLVLLYLLAACAGAAPPGGPYVWIDVPTDGLRVAVGQEVRIEGHASHHEGVARVEIWVGGELHLIQENPPAEGNLAHFTQSWMPPGAGDYVVEVIAIGADGSKSAPDAVRLTVGEAVAQVTPTPAPTPEETTETPTTTPTPEEATETPTTTPTVPPPPPSTATSTPPPETVIDFWADAEQVNAGSCIKVHWHVENVQAVFFNGAGVSGQGSHETCPCSDETHTLAVDLTDGSQEQRFITIHVNGSCVTPTPTPIPTPPSDITPPPAPSPLKPLDEAELGCVPKVMLRWDSVSDPSGIAEYRVQVERHAGDENWQPVAVSPWTGLTETELEIDVECGWYYRWRVRAVDGAANGGPFSGWFEFTVTLI